MSGRSPFRRSLAARLALVYGALSLAVVAALGAGVYLFTEMYLRARVENDLAALAGFYAAYTAAAARTETQVTALAPQIAGFFAPQAGYDVRLFSARTGGLLAATRDIGRLPSSAALAELRYRRPTLFLASSADLARRRYAARAVTGADGSVLAVVEVSRDVADEQRFLNVLRAGLLVAGGLTFVGALAVSLFLARQLTAPLRAMEAATRAIAAGRFGERVAVHSNDELGRLADGINHMAANLARLEAARRDFIAKVSHDLRTPLTAIKGFLVNLQDTAPDEMQAALATMDGQADRLIRLVDDLLALSRLQRGELRLHQTPVQLAAVARAAAAVVQAKADRLGVHLALDLPDGVPPVRADSDRVQQVLVNLLDNALRSAPQGSTVGLAVAARDGEVVATVTDSGPGLAPEAAVRAFEPYVRGPGGGAGLGLTIAREVVAAHGGRIWLTGREAGGTEAGFALRIDDSRGAAPE